MYDGSMDADLQDLTNTALHLEPGDRLALATLLIDSVEELETDWQHAWHDEVQRRSSNADARVVRGEPWADVRARLLQELAIP